LENQEERMYTAAVVGAKPPFPRVANLMKFADQLKVVAVCDLKPEWAKECAEKFAIPHVYSDFREMLKLDFDVFISFTGTYSRPDQIVAVAAAGRHIFTEKPLALSLADGQRMLDAVRRAKVRYQIGYQLRTYYFARAMKALVADAGLRQRLGANAKAVAAATYSYPAYQRAVEALYGGLTRRE
jgi:predicted dehydrogenase